eukprot:GHRR01003746.1.p1 GENE.GHRR01003746.1~~GHRR01003746.1.p1  ORF type:complete len:208 (+),score=55.12 GHRR01003746.1:205-828(+)
MGDHADGPEYKVFVGGISWQMDDNALLKEFEDNGATKAEIMMDKMTNRSRGFGFVYFNNRAGMEDAIRQKHNADIDGRRISVKEAIPQDQIPPEQRGRDRYRASGARYPDKYDSRAYDSRSYGYDRGGYDRGGYGYGGGYSDYYRDPYYGGYGGYDSRGGYGGYDSRGGYGGGYDSRGYGGHSSYGPDRGARGYGSGAARSGPYERR